MIRQNSIDAYNKITDSGLLSKRRWQVYDILFWQGPLIGAKVSFEMWAKYGIRGTSETVRNRLTELRDMGCVYEVGEQIDPATGNTVILWDVTADLPRKLPKKEKAEVRWICNFCHMAYKMDIKSFSNHPQSCMGRLEKYIKAKIKE